MIQNPTHTVHIPQPLPEVYKTFAKDWLDWVKVVNTQSVSILREQEMGLGDSSIEKGWMVGNQEIWEPYPIKWLPKKWLTPINTSSVKKDCNCTPRDLFNRGCKGH